MDAAARHARRRQRLRLVAGAAGVALIGAGAVVGWNVTHARHVRVFVSNSRVTEPQQAAIAASYVRHEFPGTGTPLARVGSPVDVLGARRVAVGTEVTAYAVIHCWTGTKDCDPGFDGTDGVVATLSGDRGVRVSYDNADDYAGGITEAAIYPPGLRDQAEQLINSDGPAGADKKAIAIAGCAKAAAA
jgi:hypothetical protein